MNKIYALHPGYIVSKTDGDKHFISYGQLLDLYQVDPKLCFRYDPQDLRHYYHRHKYIHLFPNYDGNYTLPTEKGF